MRVCVPKETREGESRVALVPDSVARLKRLGLEVLVERGAGIGSGFEDSAYEAKGAELVDPGGSFDTPIVLGVHPPSTGRLAKDQVLICMAAALVEPRGVEALAGAGVSCIALELMPRISRAQSMDVLSSMASIAGYKAVLIAAERSPKLFPLMMTAAGTVRPAKVFVLGAGVAGLQAIATAKRLGAVVEAFDVRAATKEEVQSLGAKFVEFDLGTGDQQDEGGYAKELTDDQKALQAKLMAEVIQGADVVITTANVPGRRAPILVPGEVVGGMKPGSVIVDMAAESGGNCELTVCGEEVVEHGVRICAPLNIPGSLPQSSSTLYSNNIVNFLSHVVKEGELTLDREDEVVAGPLVCHGGEITNDRVKEALK